MGFVNFALAYLGVLLITLGHGGHFVDADCLFQDHGQVIPLPSRFENDGDELVTLTATDATTLLGVPTSESEYLDIELDGDKIVVISLGRSLEDYMLHDNCTRNPVTDTTCLFSATMVVDCTDEAKKLFEIQFTVEDINNQDPVYEAPPYNSDITLPWPERVPLNKEPIIVTDADFNLAFANLSFSTNIDQKVTIIPLRSEGRPYTYELGVFLVEGQQLTLEESVIEITATDGEHMASALLNLDIKTFNVLPPEFSSPFFSFEINTPMSIGDQFEPKGSNGEIGISARDSDGQTAVEYSIGNAGDAADLVSIDRDNGHVQFEIAPDSAYFAERNNRVAVIEVIATERDGSKVPSKSTLILYFMLEETTTTEAPDTTASCPEPTPCTEPTTVPPEPCTTIEPPECTCPTTSSSTETTVTECPTTSMEFTTPDPTECPTQTTSEPSTCADCPCMTDATEGSSTSSSTSNGGSSTLFTGSMSTDESSTASHPPSTTEGTTEATESECPAHCSSTTIVVTECPITPCPTTESPMPCDCGTTDPSTITCPPPEPCSTPPPTMTTECPPPTECPATDSPCESPEPCDPCPTTPPPIECPTTLPPIECPTTLPPVECPTTPPPVDCPVTCPTPEECSGTGGLIAGIVVTSILFVASAGAAAYLLLKLRRAPKNPFQGLQIDSAEQLGGGNVSSNPRFSLANSNLGASQLKPTEFSAASETSAASPQYETLGSDGGLSSNYAAPGSSTGGLGSYEPTPASASMSDSLPVIQEAPRVTETPAAKIPRPDYAMVGFKDTVEIINADEMAYDESEDERL